MPPYDATVIARLREADAVIIGKTNMDQFGMGSSNENTGFEICRNPLDTNRVPGGSSGGSAAALAAGTAVLALGEDTGGSIRQPAAFCGVVGLKPTYGRVSRFGIIAYGSSFDQVGPMARNVEDCARLLGVIAGHDRMDTTSSSEAVPDYTANLKQGIEGIAHRRAGRVHGRGTRRRGEGKRQSGDRTPCSTRRPRGEQSNCPTPSTPWVLTTSWSPPKHPPTWRGTME